MDKPGNINNPVLKLSGEHKVILNYISRFDEFVKNNNLRSLVLFYRQNIKEFKHDILNHFHYEEKYIFPTVILKNPDVKIVKLVLSLQKEHGKLEKHIEIMAEYLSNLKLVGRNDINTFMEKAEPCLRKFKNHAKTEIIKLFPIIEETDFDLLNSKKD